MSMIFFGLSSRNVDIVREQEVEVAADSDPLTVTVTVLPLRLASLSLHLHMILWCGLFVLRYDVAMILPKRSERSSFL